MMDNEGMRLDKWLWCVRIYKTRAEAAEACHKGRIEVNGTEAKASKEVKSGDAIIVKKNPVRYSYQVLENFPRSRVGAKLVGNHVVNTTPQSELEKLEVNSQTQFAQRDRGSGRPTKKDRRQLDDLLYTQE